MEPDFDFGEALKRLRQQKRISRKPWTGTVVEYIELETRAMNVGESPSIMVKTTNRDCLIPWSVPHEDLLAADWCEVE